MSAVARKAATIANVEDRAAFVEYVNAGNALDAYTDGAIYSGNPEYRYRKASAAWFATDTYVALAARPFTHPDA